MKRVLESVWIKLLILPIAITGALLVPRLSRDPYKAETFSALAQQVQEHEAEAVRQEMTWHVSSVSTDGTDIEKQWQKIKDHLLADSDNVSEIEGVYQTAHATFTGRWWPVFMRHAEVQKQVVWVVGVAWPKQSAEGACVDSCWQTEPAFDPQKGLGQYQVAVISAEKPYKTVFP